MQQRLFRNFALGVVAYNVLVVLWGAYVRATGSGAGCGQHWPLCNGVPIPQSPVIATLIEFTHRVSSGISLVLVALLVIWAFRAFRRGHPVRRAALWSLFFIITEALIGAALVLFQLVAKDESVTRAWSHGAHLVNTFLLLAALTLTAWYATVGRRARWRGNRAAALLLGIGFLGSLLLGASGAVTALGDTLFPATSLGAGIAQDFSPTANFLIRLRIFHPVLAVMLGMYLVIAGRLVLQSRRDGETRRWWQAMCALVAIQLLVGAVNVRLLAPIPLQLVHLLLADLLWIALVVFGATALTVPQAAPMGEASVTRPLLTTARAIAAMRLPGQGAYPPDQRTNK